MLINIIAQTAKSSSYKKLYKLVI